MCHCCCAHEYVSGLRIGCETAKPWDCENIRSEDCMLQVTDDDYLDQIRRQRDLGRVD